MRIYVHGRPWSHTPMLLFTESPVRVNQKKKKYTHSASLNDRKNVLRLTGFLTPFSSLECSYVTDDNCDGLITICDQEAYHPTTLCKDHRSTILSCVDGNIDWDEIDEACLEGNRFRNGPDHRLEHSSKRHCVNILNRQVGTLTTLLNRLIVFRATRVDCIPREWESPSIYTVSTVKRGSLLD
jgi:hypothetical protein